jgi:hypothetical protein
VEHPGVGLQAVLIADVDGDGAVSAEMPDVLRRQGRERQTGHHADSHGLSHCSCTVRTTTDAAGTVIATRFSFNTAPWNGAVVAEGTVRTVPPIDAGGGPASFSESFTACDGWC